MANKSAGVAVVGHAGAARGAGGTVSGCAVNLWKVEGPSSLPSGRGKVGKGSDKKR